MEVKALAQVEQKVQAKVQVVQEKTANLEEDYLVAKVE
jgi:hypothetical protein